MDGHTARRVRLLQGSRLFARSSRRTRRSSARADRMRPRCERSTGSHALRLDGALHPPPIASGRASCAWRRGRGSPGELPHRGAAWGGVVRCDLPRAVREGRRGGHREGASHREARRLEGARALRARRAGARHPLAPEHPGVPRLLRPRRAFPPAGVRDELVRGARAPVARPRAGAHRRRDAPAAPRHGGALPPRRGGAHPPRPAGALRYLHERTPPLVHRDIKPSNVILTPDGRPYPRRLWRDPGSHPERRLGRVDHRGHAGLHAARADPRRRAPCERPLRPRRDDAGRDGGATGGRSPVRRRDRQGLARACPSGRDSARPPRGARLDDRASPRAARGVREGRPLAARRGGRASAVARSELPDRRGRGHDRGSGVGGGRRSARHAAPGRRPACQAGDDACCRVATRPRSRPGRSSVSPADPPRSRVGRGDPLPRRCAGAGGRQGQHGGAEGGDLLDARAEAGRDRAPVLESTRPR